MPPKKRNEPPEADVRAMADGKLFRGVDAEALCELLEQGQRDEYRQGDTIVEAGEYCNRAFWPKDTLVVRASADGSIKVCAAPALWMGDRE